MNESLTYLLLDEFDFDLWYLSGVLKKGSMNNSTRVQNYWFNGQTNESLVEPHNKTGLKSLS